MLDRFNTLRRKHEHVLDGMVMDILKVLNSQDMEVKRKAIGIALEMVSSRNVEDVVLFLKKQLQGTIESEFDKVGLDKSSLTAEPRIPPAPDPGHPLLRYQILRGRSERCIRAHGLPWRLEQPISSRCHCVCPVCPRPD